MYVNPHFTKIKSLVKTIIIIRGALNWVKKELPVSAAMSPRTGRLAQCTHNWSKITSDPWVLSQIQGHALELISTPTQGGTPREYQLSQLLDNKLATEILTLLEKKAISKIPPPLGRGFLSRMFVVPKKDGNVRPIIDLRDLNKFMIQEHFKMEGIYLIKDLLRGRLDGQDRPQGRLLFRSHRPSPPPPPSIPTPRCDISIQLPSLWSSISTLSVYQDIETNCSLAQTVGLSNDQLYR